jgi:prepilin-type N-terminal cleavage/methylation domain-containing protein
MFKRSAFTLIEVLISIVLLGIILPALYESVNLLHKSNNHLSQALDKTKEITKITDMLYLDILSSDGNISIFKDEFSQLCLENTNNSLYALASSKVCWIILKENHTLTRVEGNNYHLPIKLEEKVEVDPTIKDITLFDIYQNKNKVLVMLRQKGKKPISFMVQGIIKKK